MGLPRRRQTRGGGDPGKVIPSERKIVWKGIVNGEDLTETF